MRKSNLREFVQLAKVYDPDKHSLTDGWMLSEKLDGVRAVWDGGITRGLKCSEIPWANTAKDSIRRTPPISTGLWSRYGHVINAPSWFLNHFPDGVILDMELFSGRKQFQQTTSIVKRLIPDERRWKKVAAVVLDTIHPERMFADGQINGSNYTKTFDGFLHWALDTGKLRLLGIPDYNAGFLTRYQWMKDRLSCWEHPEIWYSWTENYKLHSQIRMPQSLDLAEARLARAIKAVAADGGEGLILKHQASLWTPKRSFSVLKVKPEHDMEAEVIGYTWGRETSKGSKLLGLMGALICKIPAGTFKLSGFTDAQRKMTWRHQMKDASDVGRRNPGKEVPKSIHNPFLPRGCTVTLTYRELTNDGLPKEGRFHRKFKPV